MCQVFECEYVDLIVFDFNLLCEDGLILCCDLCVWLSILVIMFIVCSELIDCVLGLEMGVDDYLVKFFELCELLVCICNVLCWIEVLLVNLELLVICCVWFLYWIFDFEYWYLVDFDGWVVVLFGVEFCLLWVFVGYVNKVLLCEQLVVLSSGCSYELQDCVIDLQVSCLCNKLGDDGGSDGLIKIVCNEGYVLVMVVGLE